MQDELVPTCQSCRLLEMSPLPRRHVFPWFRLFEKILTLPPFMNAKYNVREPVEVSSCEVRFYITSNYVFARNGVLPGVFPPMLYQKWTHSVLAFPGRTGETRTAALPAGRTLAAVLATM